MPYGRRQKHLADNENWTFRWVVRTAQSATKWVTVQFVQAEYHRTSQTKWVTLQFVQAEYQRTSQTLTSSWYGTLFNTFGTSGRSRRQVSIKSINLLNQRNSKKRHEGERSWKTHFCIIKLSLSCSFLTVVSLGQLRVIMVHLRGFDRPFVSKYLVCCCKTSSFFAFKPGYMDYPPYSSDLAIRHFYFWTTCEAPGWQTM